MTQAAEADEIDEHVLVELVSVVHRQLDSEQAGFRVVAVHVEDRRLDHLGDVGAVDRAARVARVGRGEADLVVDDDVDGAAGVEPARLRHVQAFLHHALACDGGIAVDQDRQHLIAFGVLAAVLARTHAALDDRIDDLEVRRIEREREMHRTAGCGHVR